MTGEKTKIKVSKNASLMISGDFVIEDSNGKEIPSKGFASLCRCGESKKKPFCDGRHIEINWKDDA